jgi:hypothetical protein
MTHLTSSMPKDDIPQADTHEHVNKPAEDPESRMAYQDVSDEYPVKKRRKVLWKIDIRIIPLLMILYSECPLLDDISGREAYTSQFFHTSIERTLEMPRLKAWSLTWVCRTLNTIPSCQSSSLHISHAVRSPP